MFKNKLNWLINVSGMTHLMLPSNFIDTQFWSQINLDLSEGNLKLKEIFNQYYPDVVFENIKLFDGAMEYSPDTTISRLNHILFIPKSNSVAEVCIKHLPKISLNTNGILLVDSLFSVRVSSHGVISATLKNVQGLLEFRILDAYLKSVAYFDSKGWGQDCWK